jgi:hypothetical protein
MRLRAPESIDLEAGCCFCGAKLGQKKKGSLFNYLEKGRERGDMNQDLNMQQDTLRPMQKSTQKPFS